MQDLKEIDFERRLTEVIETFILNTQNEVRHVWNTWEIDINKKEIFEVIAGILTRQVSIATNFIVATNNWNNEIAPIIFRSMADNYINLVWILKDPLDRSRKFIAYGLGQEKLNMEHRKNQMISEGRNPENDPIIKSQKAWIEFQQYDFLTSVDIARWSGISVYQMAQEADCIDFYNYVYNPFSVAAHNMWNHIGKFNLKISDNPLHKYMFMPNFEQPGVEYFYAELVAKYVGKCISSICTTFEIASPEVNSYKVLKTNLLELAEKFSAKE